MTYSNINKDKVQVIGAGILAGALIISAIMNIWKQYRSLSMAERKNSQLKSATASLKLEIANLDQQVRYATSSAAKERLLRGTMGLGTKDDYWIKLLE